LLQENGGFTSFFHGDAVEIKIVKNAEWYQAEHSKNSKLI
jgi:hypothetical protein